MSFNSHKSWHVKKQSNITTIEKKAHEEKKALSIREKIKKQREKERDEEQLKQLSEENFEKANPKKKSLDFLYEAPPGLYDKEPEEKPEDIIPDTPENAQVRNFLKKAPTSGLWLPLGQEVKVMQCWRCKQYGHRTGDRDCPLYLSGNAKNEERNKFREDPMAYYISDKRKRQEDQHKEEKKEKKLKKHKKERKRRKRNIKNQKRRKKENIFNQQTRRRKENN